VFLDKQAFTDWPEGDRREMDLLAEVPVADLAQRFGAVPEPVRAKVEAIDSTEVLSDLAGKVWEVKAIDEMGL
jgi:hypothetical protein